MRSLAHALDPLVGAYLNLTCILRLRVVSKSMKERYDQECVVSNEELARFFRRGNIKSIGLVQHATDKAYDFQRHELFTIACTSNQFELAKWLGARYFYKCDWSLFKTVCALGNLEFAQWLAAYFRIGRDTALFFGRHHTAADKHLNIFQWFYTDIMDITDVGPQHVIACATFGHLEILNWIVQPNILIPDVNRWWNSFLNSAFECAATKNHLDIMQCLNNVLGRNLHPNTIQSAWIESVKCGCLEICEWLHVTFQCQLTDDQLGWLKSKQVSEAKWLLFATIPQRVKFGAKRKLCS